MERQTGTGGLSGLGKLPGKDAPCVLVFGGTTEGIQIVEWLSRRKTCLITASALTQYGGSLVEGLPRVESLSGRLVPKDMEQLIRARGFSCVIDATHPYATGISASIARVTRECGVPAVRILREGEPEGPWTSVADVREAAKAVAVMPGRVLFTTGSRDLPLYAELIPGFTQRSVVRVLPVAASIDAATELGLDASNIIAMKGPFSKEFNVALIHERAIDVMVTKASGAAGGFWEKVEAARECGVKLVVISRPVEEEGFDIEQAKRVLECEYGL